MGLQVYDTIYAFLDGLFLQEVTEEDISLEGDNQRILTLGKGFAGMSPSPKVLVVSLTSMMPPTGSEFDAWKAFMETTIHELKLLRGASGQVLISQGFIETPKATAGVGKATSESCVFVGAPSTWA